MGRPVSFVFYPNRKTYASNGTAYAVPSNTTDGQTGGVDITSWSTSAQNGHKSSNVTIIFTSNQGGGTTITPELYGYDTETGWNALGSLGALTIPSNTVNVARLMNAIGCWERLAVSGTLGAGTGTVIFVPTSAVS